jgi:hypothetical protein
MSDLHVRALGLLVLTGCVAGDVEGQDEPPLAPASIQSRAGTRAVGQGLVPYQHPQLWPHHVDSPRIVVHYRAPEELGMAKEVLAHLEYAWRIQITRHGASPPLDDRGLAGPDGRFDVYLWRGIDTMYVDAIAANDATWYDDWSTFMVLDPWGQYGGAELAANLFHELRHASQGSDDWWEHIHIFEADATLWEVAHFGFERLPKVWRDFQAHPEWTLFRDDGYRTWYMYGGALFLMFVGDHVFKGDLSFTNDMWRRSRNAPGADADPRLNEPDFTDALQTILAARGTSLYDQVVAFARARWHTGVRDDGTLPGAAVLPEVAHKKHVRRTGATRTSVGISPQLLGTSYVEVQRASSDPATVWVSLSSNSGAVRFVVQAVSGGSPDAILDLSAGPAPVRFGPSGKVALVVTALPGSAGYDPDTVSQVPANASLTISTTR